MPGAGGEFSLFYLRIFNTLISMLGLEQVAELLERNRAAAKARVKEFTIGGRRFAFNSQPAIMGVVNLSADSWYRESVCLTAESAVRRGRVMHEQGADIVDVGAESTLAFLLSLAEMRLAQNMVRSFKEPIAIGT